MGESLDGKVALVVGGGRGIGAAVARRLAADGADVGITFLERAGAAEEVVADVRGRGRRALALAADSADPVALTAAVDRVAAELGGLDVLVNSAGIFPYGPLEQVTREEVDRTLAVHVTAAFVAAQAAARHMRPGGRIVSIGSCFAERVPVPGLTLYAMSKAALDGLTRGLARDLGPRGITANLIHPGPTDTEMNPADGEGADEERALTALGRYAQPEEVAAAVAMLAHAESGALTGAAIRVDGGYAA